MGTPPSAGPAVEVRGLSKRFGKHAAVDDLDLAVAPGVVFGLVGPNGAGKTTTLRMLLDVIRPTAGVVRVLGQDPRRAGPALRRRIGYVPGDLRLDGRVTGRRLLAFYAGVSGGVRSGEADALAERLGVELDRPVRTLSKGNRQKLGLVQAFWHRPELLVLDEPTSGLDPLLQREFLALVREARDAGQTVLLSSHVLSELQQVADEIVVLAHGRVVAEGDVASLRLSTVRHVQVGLGDTSVEAVQAALAPIGTLREVDVREQGGAVRVSATADGEIDPLVKALARFRVLDLSAQEPDLEESVLRLYGQEGTGG
ncbi:ABC transporter ATP-binding protein [Miniimonas sp. S16]|uniref:ABC transporter ATP-binding protein n=1 Tax=Miniimonas sp. S16 TaxID=2171623 RepID=UPI000D528959|nr:ABC transporter ATP-binding protein [Miniimonas sp. S16]